MATQPPSSGDQTNGLYRIANRMPMGWSPSRIVYSRYSCGFEAGSSSGSKILKFSAPRDSLSFPVQELSAFVKAVIADQQGPGEPLPKGAHSPKAHTRLDVAIVDSCLVVLELDPAISWQFRTYDVGLTTKADYSDTVGLLRHFDSNGEYLPPERPSENGCRFAAFTALKPRDGEARHFNLHIEFPQEGSRSLEVMLDPDIPNDGGHLP